MNVHTRGIETVCAQAYAHVTHNIHIMSTGTHHVFTRARTHHVTSYAHAHVRYVMPKLQGIHRHAHPQTLMQTLARVPTYIHTHPGEWCSNSHTEVQYIHIQVRYTPGNTSSIYRKVIQNLIRRNAYTAGLGTHAPENVRACVV